MHFTGASVTLALLPALGSATRLLAGPSDQQAALGQSNYQQPPGKDASSLQAAPNQSDQTQSSPNQNAGNYPGVNDCGVSSFIKLVQPQSAKPTVDDCQQMLQTILDDTTWLITEQDSYVVQYGTCSFNAVVSEGQPPGSVAYLGNADCIDLVTDSINKYAENGVIGCHGDVTMYVASSGAMHCDQPNNVLEKQGTQVSVDWTLTKTEQQVPPAPEWENGQQVQRPGTQPFTPGQGTPFQPGQNQQLQANQIGQPGPGQPFGQQLSANQQQQQHKK